MKGGVVTQREKEEVVKQLKTADLKGKRGEYLKLTIEEKREIGDYAKTNGVPATVRKYKTMYPTLSRNTVSDYRRYARDKVVLKSRGRPTLLPEEIMPEDYQRDYGVTAEGSTSVDFGNKQHRNRNHKCNRSIPVGGERWISQHQHPVG